MTADLTLVRDAAAVDPGMLDGWDVDDVQRALEDAVLHAGRVRHLTGLLLWKLRTLLPDGDYGREVAKLAERFDVTVATLGRWRNSAEAVHELPAPDARTEGTRRKAAGGGQAKHSGDSREKITPDDVIPPAKPVNHAESGESQGETRESRRDSHQPTLPGAEAWGVVLELSIDELARFPKDELKNLQRRVNEALRRTR